MVFRRKARARRARFGGFRKAARRYIGGSNVESMILPAIGYGALRDRASQEMSKYIPQVFGAYTNGIILGVSGWYMAKKTRGIWKTIGTTALIGEGILLGHNALSPMVGGTSTNQANGVQIGTI